MNDKKQAILCAVEQLTENYKKEDLFNTKNGKALPSRSAIIEIVRDLRSVIFPGYFGVDSSSRIFPEHYVGYRLNFLYDRLKEQIEIALLYYCNEEETELALQRAEEI